MCVQFLSQVQLLVAPGTVARQAPWDFPYKNTGVSYRFILQGIFLTQGSSPALLYLLHWQEGSLPLVPPLLSWGTKSRTNGNYQIIQILQGCGMGRASDTFLSHLPQ